jgi:hypothetical protein
MRFMKRLLLLILSMLVAISPHIMLGIPATPKKKKSTTRTFKNKSIDALLHAKVLNDLLRKKNLGRLELNTHGEDLSEQDGLASLFRQTAPFIFLQGNLIRVDQVFGSDSLGARNGTPFVTIHGALNAASYGDIVQLFPGTYNESFIIPSGVSIIGINSNAVIISQNVTTATDLVTMGENSRLENVTLSLTSSSHVQLRGIVFPGTTAATATVKSVSLTVDNSSAGSGSSIIYGVHSTGTGIPAKQTVALHASTITVNSTGGGSKRGVLVDAANNYHIRDCDIAITNSGTGSSIGVETNNTNAAFNAQGSTLNGRNTSTPTASADISQTTGSISLGASNLVNATANGFGFTTTLSPMVLVWASQGQIAKNTTTFINLNGSANTTPMYARCDQARTLKALSIQAQSAPISTETYTVFHNGIQTPFTVSLTNSSTSNVNNTQSLTFAAGDTIALQVTTSSGKGSVNPVVTMELY